MIDVNPQFQLFFYYIALAFRILLKEKTAEITKKPISAVTPSAYQEAS